MTRPLTLCAALLSLCICSALLAQTEATQASTEPATEIAPAGQLMPLAVPAAPPLSVDEVLAVPEELRQLVNQKVVQLARHPTARLEKLVEFMFSPSGLGLTYDDTTRTVAQTFADRKGNCLSFTLLFLEMARSTGLTADMQESEKVLLSFSDTDTLVYTGHVSASIKINGRRQEIQFDPNNPILRGSVDIITKARSVAHYYNNRGAELMVAGHLDEADAHFAQAIELDPRMVQAHSNRGVLHMRLKDPNAAEYHFKAALAIDPKRISVLSKLVSLYRSQGRSKEEALTAERLADVEEDDPYHHFVHGLQLESRGEFEPALEHYRAAAKLDRKQPLYQLGMARAYEGLGREDMARHHAERAQALSRRKSSTSFAIQMMRGGRQ